MTRRLVSDATTRFIHWLRQAADPSPSTGKPAEDAGADPPGDLYEMLYESHATSQTDETVVGDLSLGPIELEILVDHGLRPTDTLVDLGCGIGRLACEVARWMDGGEYIGTDVSDTMLRRAQSRLAALDTPPKCTVRWIKQRGTTFDLPDQSADMISAFSVFTHIEHEDTYNFLHDGRRLIRPDGRFVFSCLPMDLLPSRYLFDASARLDFSERWARIRNVTTSVDLMDAISRMAGWEPERWIPTSTDYFGQTICVLRPGAGGPAVA
ncbi:MAG: hypothetical protein QOJ69_2151 [Actinomycetota bacterium]|nr:hypothetical protein [Actinomycetota bacterium]